MNKYLDWSALQNDLLLLQERMDVNPDYLVGCTPDGLVVAQMLGGLMEVDNVRVLSYVSGGKFIGDFSDDIKNKTILLVFPLIEDRELVDSCKKHIESKGGKVLVAGLYATKGPKNYDFSISEVERVVFPWKNF